MGKIIARAGNAAAQVTASVELKWRGVGVQFSRISSKERAQFLQGLTAGLDELGYNGEVALFSHLAEHGGLGDTETGRVGDKLRHLADVLG